MNEEEEMTEAEMKKALAAVFKQSQTDAEFREICLKDPAEAIFQVTGKRLPEGSNLQFSEPEDKKKDTKITKN
jgi:hypothetical protein